MVIFGYSDGAQFAHRWVYQNLERVRVWCIYSFRQFDETPKDKKIAPGIFACGLDDENLSTTRDGFLSALRAKAPACWLGVAHTGHVVHDRAAAFIIDYFDAELNKPANAPEVWKQADDRGLEGFLVRSRFPDEKTAEEWRIF